MNRLAEHDHRRHELVALSLSTLASLLRSSDDGRLLHERIDVDGGNFHVSLIDRLVGIGQILHVNGMGCVVGRSKVGGERAAATHGPQVLGQDVGGFKFTELSDVLGNALQLPARRLVERFVGFFLLFGGSNALILGSLLPVGASHEHEVNIVLILGHVRRNGTVVELTLGDGLVTDWIGKVSLVAALSIIRFSLRDVSIGLRCGRTATREQMLLGKVEAAVGLAHSAEAGLGATHVLKIFGFLERKLVGLGTVKILMNLSEMSGAAGSLGATKSHQVVVIVLSHDLAKRRNDRIVERAVSDGLAVFMVLRNPVIATV